MSSHNSYSKLGYFIFKKETAENAAVYPDVGIEVLAEDITVNWAMTAVGTIAGKRNLNLRSVLDQIEPATGNIEFFLDQKLAGHLLAGLTGEATDVTLESGKSYQHDFQESGSGVKTFTFDVKTGGESTVQRHFGVKIESWTLAQDENRWKVTMAIQAQTSFTNARVLEAASSGTTLKVDQTTGLTTSDTIQVLDKDDPETVIAEYTIAAIVDETTLTVSTIGDSLSVDDIVMIKSQTFSASPGNEMIFKGGTEIYLASGANPLQNLVQSTDVEGLEITFTNELEPRYGASGCHVVNRFASKILVKGWSVEVSFNRFYTSPKFLAWLRSNTQVGMRVKICGSNLSDNAAAAASGTIETGGAGTLTVSVDTAGEAGNDYAIIVEQGTGSLAATLSGKLITLTLDATPANNDETSVATVLNALTGVSCSDTGTDLVTTTDNPNKIEFASGRDANEDAAIIIDFSDLRFSPFNANISTDDIVNEEITAMAFYDDNDQRDVRIRVRNEVADY